MKTNIAITTIALALLTQASMAGKIQSRPANPHAAPIQSPAASSRAMNRLPMPSANRMVIPAARFSPPKAPLPTAYRPAIHPKATQRVSPAVVGRPPIPPAPSIRKPQQLKDPATINHHANPGINRNLAGGKGSVGRIPPVKPQTSALAGIDAGKAESIRQGAELAKGLKDIESLRPGSFREGLPDGLPAQAGNGSSVQPPADPFAENNNYDRKPKAPDHISSNTRGGGLTDIRGGRDNSRKGTPGSYSDLTPTTRRVAESGSGTVFGHGSGSTASGPVEVRQDEESGEFVASQTGTNANGNQARIDVIQNTDENGHVTGTTEIVTQSDGDSCSQRTIIRDSTGAIISDKTEKTTPGTQGCDRSTGDVAMGGPVGPGAAAITGLVPLDLLRQPSGNESSGGVNLMTSGQLNRNHVNPGTRDGMNPLPGPRRDSAVRGRNNLAGPTGGGSAGGGDIPD